MEKLGHISISFSLGKAQAGYILIPRTIPNSCNTKPQSFYKMFHPYNCAECRRHSNYIHQRINESLEFVFDLAKQPFLGYSQASLLDFGTFYASIFSLFFSITCATQNSAPLIITIPAWIALLIGALPYPTPPPHSQK